MESPVGPLRLVSDGAALTRLAFDDDAVPNTTDEPILVAARSQLDGYFAGRRREFDLPLAPAGTPFQLSVGEKLRCIPFGTTVSYGDIAAWLGMPPGASRAVGLANGANPIAIVVPCHRVIGSAGALVGYGGGLARKQFLLDLEAPTRQGSLFDD
jgi:methylated-DNA-[protein]-cysteine S-methyltransferase